MSKPTWCNPWDLENQHPSEYGLQIAKIEKLQDKIKSLEHSLELRKRVDSYQKNKAVKARLEFSNLILEALAKGDKEGADLKWKFQDLMYIYDNEREDVINGHV